MLGVHGARPASPCACRDGRIPVREAGAPPGHGGRAVAERPPPWPSRRLLRDARCGGVSFLNRISQAASRGGRGPPGTTVKVGHHDVGAARGTATAAARARGMVVGVMWVWPWIRGLFFCLLSSSAKGRTKIDLRNKHFLV